MNKNNFWKMVIVAAVLIGLLVAGWFFIKDKTAEENGGGDQTQETGGWQTYRNYTDKYEFKYPNDWELVETRLPGLIVLLDRKVFTEFSKKNDTKGDIAASVYIDNSHDLNIIEVLENGEHQSFNISGGRAVKIKVEKEVLNEKLGVDKVYFIRNDNKKIVSFDKNEKLISNKNFNDIIFTFRFID